MPRRDIALFSVLPTVIDGRRRRLRFLLVFLAQNGIVMIELIVFLRKVVSIVGYQCGE